MCPTESLCSLAEEERLLLVEGMGNTLQICLREIVFPDPEVPGLLVLEVVLWIEASLPLLLSMLVVLLSAPSVFLELARLQSSGLLELLIIRSEHLSGLLLSDGLSL